MSAMNNLNGYYIEIEVVELDMMSGHTTNTVYRFTDFKRAVEMYMQKQNDLHGNYASVQITIKQNIYVGEKQD